MPSPDSPAGRRGRLFRGPALPAAALLLALLLAVNAVAVWGIVSARRSAEAEAVRGLGLTLAAQGRALEADLASLAGDLLFIASSPVLARAPGAMESADPMARRWARLDAEASLLLFLGSRPEVERLILRGADGDARVAVGRRQGAPVVVAAAAAEPDAEAGGLRGSWALPGGSLAGDGGAARLEAWVSPAALVDRRRGMGGGAPAWSLEEVPLPVAAAPGADPSALADAGSGDSFAVAPGDDGRLRVSALVVAEGWRPPRAWMLSREVEAASLVGGLEALAGRTRTTLVVNLVIVTLTAILGGLALREVRRSSRLAAENAQQSRVRELERRVLHQERLAGVGRLAAGMAHEINNPLAGMANYLRLLQDDLERGRVDAARGAAAKVETGLHRVAAITRQVLDYSDPARAPKRPVDLAREVEATVAFVDESAACPGVEVVSRIEGGGAAKGVWVRGNVTTLGQVLLNLVLNACQARREEGAGQPSHRSPAEPGVEVVLAVAGGTARLEVRDRGPGLPEEDRSRLFEPFFSTRGSTGLGLAICQGVVRDHGGEIRALPRPGGGSVFRVELPLLPAAEIPVAGSSARAVSETASNADASGAGASPRPGREERA